MVSPSPREALSLNLIFSDDAEISEYVEDAQSVRRGAYWSLNDLSREVSETSDLISILRRKGLDDEGSDQPTLVAVKGVVAPMALIF